MTLNTCPTWNLTMADAAQAHMVLGDVLATGGPGFFGLSGGFTAGFGLESPAQSGNPVKVDGAYAQRAPQSQAFGIARDFTDNPIPSPVC